jgi:hypothetical protein
MGPKNHHLHLMSLCEITSIHPIFAHIMKKWYPKKKKRINPHIHQLKHRNSNLNNK